MDVGEKTRVDDGEVRPSACGGEPNAANNLEMPRDLLGETGHWS